MEEGELIRGLREGSSEALSYFIRKYRGIINLVVGRYVWNYHDREDVVMETIEDVWQKIDKHKGDQYKLSTWVQTIARNNAIDYRRKMRPLWWEDMLLLRESPLPNPEQELMMKDDLSLIGKLVDGMKKPINRKMVTMRSVGYSFAEIAHEFKIPETTARTRTWRHQMEIYGSYEKICSHGLK